MLHFTVCMRASKPNKYRNFDKVKSTNFDHNQSCLRYLCAGYFCYALFDVRFVAKIDEENKAEKKPIQRKSIKLFVLISIFLSFFSPTLAAKFAFVILFSCVRCAMSRHRKGNVVLLPKLVHKNTKYTNKEISFLYPYRQHKKSSIPMVDDCWCSFAESREHICIAAHRPPKLTRR